jgi:hypothetical protein
MYNNVALYVYVCMFSLNKIMRDQIERDYIIIAFITWDQYFYIIACKISLIFAMYNIFNMFCIILEF